MLNAIFLAALLVGAASSASVPNVQLKLTSCLQSTTIYGAVCNRAIDDNTNPNWDKNSCTHTSESAKGWWTASTERPARIREIRIYNRQDWYSWRLNDFVITVDGHECASYKSLYSFSVKTFHCNRVGQTVTIISRIYESLTLCEVQVLGELISDDESPGQLALKSCYQSSTMTGTGGCGRAIDGNANQQWSGNSCTATNVNAKGWLTASTEKLAHIREVRIYNRIDAVPERLNNFVITVDGHQCAAYNSDIAFSVRTFKCDRVGQAIAVKSLLNDVLTLCELQVFGELVIRRSTQLKLKGCYQSSDDESGVCNRAIDGNANQNWNGGSCSLTKWTEKGWWRAHFEQLAYVRSVRIYNRIDNAAWRLNNFFIVIDGHPCASYKSDTSFSVMTLKCNRIGHLLTIISQQVDALTLCEVQAFGTLISDNPRYIGCFVDSSDRTLPHHAATGAMTVAMCNRLCSEKQYVYFGLQAGAECWCGNSYDKTKKKSSSECNSPCNGDKSAFCGAGWRNSIYTIGLKVRGSNVVTETDHQQQ